MHSIYTDFNKINNTDGKLYLGNKLLHIFFIINLASKFDLKLKIPNNYGLKDLFLLKEKAEYARTEEFKKIKLEFSENSIFNIYNTNSKISYYFTSFINLFKNNKSIKKELIEKSLKQFEDAKKFQDQLSVQNDFYISVNFWHYDLMPTQNIIENYISINKQMINKIKNKISDIDSEKSVAIHFRGQDFKSHLKAYFKNSIKLDKSYFEKAIRLFIKNFGGEYKFYLFSDEMETLSEYLKDFKINKIKVDNQTALEDWICLMLSRNIIQSNSSFCWTASLFNKKISIQPKNGYGYNDNFGPIPYGFYIKNSIIV